MPRCITLLCSCAAVCYWLHCTALLCCAVLLGPTTATLGENHTKTNRSGLQSQSVF